MRSDASRPTETKSSKEHLDQANAAKARPKPTRATYLSKEPVHRSFNACAISRTLVRELSGRVRLPSNISSHVLRVANELSVSALTQRRATI